MVFLIGGDLMWFESGYFGLIVVFMFVVLVLVMVEFVSVELGCGLLVLWWEYVDYGNVFDVLEKGCIF